MTKMFAVATLAVMFASPLPGQAAENGLSRNGVSLENGISRNGISRNGISRNGITRNGASLDAGTIPDSAVLIAVELPR